MRPRHGGVATASGQAFLSGKLMRRTYSVIQGAAKHAVVPHAMHHKQQAVAPGDEQAQEGEGQGLGLAGHKGMRFQVVHPQEGQPVAC